METSRSYVQIACLQLSGFWLV